MTSGSDVAIQSYLKLGYFIDFDQDVLPFHYKNIDRNAYVGVSRENLEKQGHEALLQSIERDFRSTEDHVVPLSGGYDSRLILAALREFLPAERLHTYTFGEPGSYDYELGTKVAKAAGTRHVTLPLRWSSWQRADLDHNALRSQGQGLLFYMHPTRLLEMMYGGTTMWSGYAGDLVAGSKLHKDPAPSEKVAQQRYLQNRRFVRTLRLGAADNASFLPFMAGAFTTPDVVSYDEQIMIAEGLAKFTAPSVLNSFFKTHTPQFNTPWADFFFSVPSEFRHGQNLMLSGARRFFPDLFELPSKNTLGLSSQASGWRRKLKVYTSRARKLAHQFMPSVSWPFHQYYDYHEAFRTDADMKALVHGLLQDFKRRDQLVCDIDALWSRHQSRQANLGDVFALIASAEACLAYQNV